MRISDWSSDVCSSDLSILILYWEFTPRSDQPSRKPEIRRALRILETIGAGDSSIESSVLRKPDLAPKVFKEMGPLERVHDRTLHLRKVQAHSGEIGRAQGRERVCPYG